MKYKQACPKACKHVRKHGSKHTSFLIYTHMYSTLIEIKQTAFNLCKHTEKNKIKQKQAFYPPLVIRCQVASLEQKREQRFINIGNRIVTGQSINQSISQTINQAIMCLMLPKSKTLHQTISNEKYE